MKVKTMSVKDGEYWNIEQFPNFSISGSIKGMKKKYYSEDALLIRCGGYIYYVGNLFANPKGQCMTLGQTLYYFHTK